MDKKQNCFKIAKHMAVLFGAYGQSGDIDRQKIYVADLADFPAELIGVACKKLRLESHFLPTISEIIEAARSLTATNTGKRLPSWAEAQHEIERQLNIAGNYKKPEFSCKEIRQAVQAYGWLNICMTNIAGVGRMWERLQKLYEQACQYERSESTNLYVLKDKPEGYLGYCEAKNDGLLLIAHLTARE